MRHITVPARGNNILDLTFTPINLTFVSNVQANMPIGQSVMYHVMVVTINQCLSFLHVYFQNYVIFILLEICFLV